MASPKKTYKFPKAIGACADKLYKLKEERLKQQKIADELKAEEEAIKRYIIDNLPKSEASGVAGKVARVTVVSKEKPTVVDQEAFRKFINKTKRFDLANNLQPSAPAIAEMWEDGKTVPGIDKFNFITVSLNKI